MTINQIIYFHKKTKLKIVLFDIIKTDKISMFFINVDNHNIESKC